MASWSQFSTAEPRLAAAIRALIEQYGPGFGYLATVRADGGPRIHPVCPVVTDEGLFCFLIDSPKRRDLERDGRYALHSFPAEDSDDEAYLAGRARPVTNLTVIDRLAREHRAAPDVDWRLFEFNIEVAMLTRGRGSSVFPRAVGGAWAPRVDVWIDPSGARARGRLDHVRRLRSRGAGPVVGAGTADPVCA